MNAKSKRALLHLVPCLLVVALIVLVAHGLTARAKHVAPEWQQTEGDRTPQQPHDEARLRDAMGYLLHLPAIAWYEVEGSEVYVGFHKWPSDGQIILNGAARHGAAVISDTMCTVWGLSADTPTRRPGENCFGWTIVHHGKLQTPPIYSALGKPKTTTMRPVSEQLP